MEENEKDIEKFGGVNGTPVYFLELNSLTSQFRQTKFSLNISLFPVIEFLMVFNRRRVQNLYRLDLPGFLVPK